MNEMINLRGSNFFRIKIAYSLLLNKPIIISNIRDNSINPGLTDYEISFLKLIEKITNGTKVEISRTGTIIKFYPGIITNNYGEEIEFDCDNSRAVSYYLEGIIPIAMFGKETLKVKLTGVTNNEIDISVDTFKSVTCQLIQRLVIGDKVEFDIKKRGVFPLGNGEVTFRCPIITFLNPFDWIDEGKIRRIRGTAFTSRIPNAFSTRMIDASRGVFNNFLPDVWIAVDNFKSKNKEEISPGYGISLVGETTNGFFFSADTVNNTGEEDLKLSPEDLSRKCALKLLDEIFYCGAIDTHHQPLFIFMMAIATNKAVSKIKLGRLSPTSIGLLRFINKLLGVKFIINEFEKDDYDEEIEEEDENEDMQLDDNNSEREEEDDDMDEINKDAMESKCFIFSCIGIGLKNVARIEM